MDSDEHREEYPIRRGSHINNSSILTDSQACEVSDMLPTEREIEEYMNIECPAEEEQGYEQEFPSTEGIEYESLTRPSISPDACCNK